MINRLRFGLIEGEEELGRYKLIFLKLLFIFLPRIALKKTLSWIQPDTYLHSVRVRNISLAIAENIERKYAIYVNTGILKRASLFHDIGKLGIDHRLLTKRILSVNERAIIKKHPEIGLVLADRFFKAGIKETILAHHREIDGTGYPEIKTTLSLITMIVSTADDFCAMTESRGYNIPLSNDKALEELEKEKGKRYDPKILEALRIYVQNPKNIPVNPD